jgi:hypothetical protein
MDFLFITLPWFSIFIDKMYNISNKVTIYYVFLECFNSNHALYKNVIGLTLFPDLNPGTYIRKRQMPVKIDHLKKIKIIICQIKYFFLQDSYQNLS